MIPIHQHEQQRFTSQDPTRPDYLQAVVDLHLIDLQLVEPTFAGGTDGTTTEHQ
jgi:hypothetical protein